MNRTKPNSCEGCSCYSHGSDFTQVEGQGSLGVMIVGEASGEHEAREQLPFRAHAPAGSLLQRCINRLGYNREQFTITNTLRCQPRKNWLTGAPWEYSALRQCRPNLVAAVRDRMPKAILALGETALRELTGEAGEARGVSHLRGYILPLLMEGMPQIPVIPSWHPAFIRRGKAQYQGVFMRDMQRSVVVAQGRDKSYIWDAQKSDRIKYHTRPSWDDCRSFYLWLKDNPQVHFSYDLETVETLSLDEDAREQFTDTVIRTIQFSAEEATGWSFPWCNGYRQIASDIMQLSNWKFGFNNWGFDDKVLRAVEQREGLPLAPKTQGHDVLQMFHHWQPDLPAHLQAAASMANFPFPWKHLSGSDLEFYGCADVDATLRLYNTLKKTMDRDDIWGAVGSPYGYCGQVYDVRPVLAKMEQRGLPVNDEKRLKLDVEFDLAEKELDAEIQAMVPNELRPVEPRRGKKGSYSYGYLNVPKDLTGLVEKTFQEVALVDGEPKMVEVARWCRLLPFNANSPDQLKAYIKFKGYKVPKSIKEEDAEGNPKETTEKKQLLRLAQQHDDKLFLKAIEYKELGKARGTYINGFKPMADGCVHTTFGFDTGIGQLSCCAPWTPVETRRGILPISDIVVGDEVWTHLERWRPVTAVWKYPPQEMVEVHFSNGEVLTCLTSHKLLLSLHEREQVVDDRRTCGSSHKAISEQESSYSPDYCQRDEHQAAQHLLDTSQSNGTARVSGVAETSLLAIEAGQEQSMVRQEGEGQSPLEGNLRRWTRISDLLSKWPSGICASNGDGQGIGIEEATSQVRGTSHRWRSEEQFTGQFGSSDKSRPQSYSLAPTHRGEVVTIEKIVPVGCFSVHDITVDEDESYASCGVFSHNSKNPNVQNFPKHGRSEAQKRIVKALRGMIEAQPGKELSEWDFKSCHVLTLGFLAESANYIRLARLDMHSFVAGHFLKCWDGPTILSESDDELKARFKWLKSDPYRKHVRDDQAKHAILGIGNGLKGPGLYKRYPENFDNQKHACKFLDIIEFLFPEVFQWQKRMQQLAHDQTWLKTQFKHIRRFYEVFRWESKRRAWVGGDQAEQAISFWLSNIAFGHIREKMKALDRAGLAEKYGLVNNVHDSFVFHYDKRLREEHLAEVYPVLVSPSEVLRHPTIAPGGLWIGVECAIGNDWSEMVEVEVGKVKKEAATV